ncbi:MAG: hypothetical protein GY868_00175, partial [Deltaproteobacteria bacterium]|nr:hypothetical protein [Deltaproteobacteria bacterium]
FGVSTFTARLPFVLIALLTVVLTYAAGRSLWQCRRAGLSAALLLSCTIPFLLLARQCRYYAPATFFALAVLYCYWNGAQKKKRYAVLLFVAGTLLFHTNFVYCAAALVAVLAHAVLLRRRDLKRTVSVCVLIVVVNAPWFLWIADIDYAGRYGGLNAAMLPEALQRYGWYVWEHCFSVFIIPVAAVVGGWTLFRNRKVFLGDGSTRSAAALFLLFLLCCSCYAVSCCRPFVITRRFFVIVRRSCRSAVC